ncbi:restriction endonuclease subunit S [candidate division WOR-3 bacterium]|nr:restriction endonuclease subunit S [candidate division WOR-3 bacterium]
MKKYSDTQSALRIDAEYFQPMYEEIIKELVKYKNGYGSLGDLVKIKDRNFIPKDEVSYKYIELANISVNGNITGFTEALGNELPTRARRKINRDDVIVSSIGGSLSSIALITELLDNALCSTGFYVVNSENINSETSLVFLKSKAGQLQLKKGCSGTILTAISKDEFAKLIIPKIADKIQNEIKIKITEMYKAKTLSNELLNIAKRGVEIAIEKDEKQAQNWINSEMKKLNIK